MASKEVALLVLAAGKGSRMGGPKALLVVDGEPLARLHAKSCANSILVVRADVAAKLSLPPHVRVVESTEEDSLGPAGSLRAAVRSGALDAVDVAIVTPVDRMPATRETVDALVRALEGHDAARPSRGHPIAIRGHVLRRLYRDDATSLRDVLASLDTAILDLPACAARDLDTPDDLEAATGKRPVFLDPK